MFQYYYYEAGDKVFFFNLFQKQFEKTDNFLNSAKQFELNKF